MNDAPSTFKQRHVPLHERLAAVVDTHPNKITWDEEGLDLVRSMYYGLDPEAEHVNVRVRWDTCEGLQVAARMIGEEYEAWLVLSTWAERTMTVLTVPRRAAPVRQPSIAFRQ